MFIMSNCTKLYDFNIIQNLLDILYFACPRRYHVHSQKSRAHRWERDKNTQNTQTEWRYRLEMKGWTALAMPYRTGAFVHGINTIILYNLCGTVGLRWSARDNGTYIARIQTFLHEKRGFSVDANEISSAENCVFDRLSKSMDGIATIHSMAKTRTPIIL